VIRVALWWIGPVVCVQAEKQLYVLLNSLAKAEERGPWLHSRS
jgi:hypothetical protein